MTSSTPDNGMYHPYQFDSVDNNIFLTPPSSQVTQRSRTISPSQVDDRPSSNDRSWQNVWQEVIGLPQHDQQEGYLYDDGNNSWQNGHVSFSFVEDEIESWARKELDSFQDTLNLDTPPASQLSVVQNAEPESAANICYGTIHQVKMKLIGNMNRVVTSLNSSDVRRIRSHYLLDVTYRDEMLLVMLSDDLAMGQLNEQLKEAMKDLVVNQAVSLEVLVHHKGIFDDIGTATKLNTAHTVVNINVYGPGDVSIAVGKILSSHKIWLQRPDWSRPGCKYNNPHFMQVTTAISTHDPDSTSHDEAIAAEETIQFQESIDQVYSMLTRNTHLKRVSAGQRLKTALYPHQEEALDFMLQRENGPVPDEYQLWEETKEKEQTWYRHTIAGLKSRALPSESGGGILADEMGIGKTFSILALVEKTLEDAERWRSDPEIRLADDIPPSKRLSRATLVVVPSPLLIKTWLDEIRKHINMKIEITAGNSVSSATKSTAVDILKVLVYHGNQRPDDSGAVLDNDIVVTTYHTLIADHHRERTPIVDTAWYRIVLDEAHFIRRQTTYLHRRVAELEAKFRWCLTGTPIQNRLDDLGSLFTFLRISPFDRLSVFRQCIAGPFNDKMSNNRRQIGQRNLAKLLDSLCLRRTKKLLNLTNIFETTHPIVLSEAEQRQYEKMKHDMKRTMQHDVDSIDRRSRFGLFQTQLQLRLLCNHGTFQHQFHWARARTLIDEREDMLSLAGLQGETHCSACQQSICSTDMESAYDLQDSCAHVLCTQCKYGFEDRCPLCEAINSKVKHGQDKHERQTPYSQAGYFRPDGYSTKMERLVQELGACDVCDKSIVFSQWTSTLDLISQHLKREHIKFERIDGKTDIRQRQEVLEEFEHGRSFSVLIMTTGVGAFGLNLIAANRVFIVEPQWNPSTELQAIGRTMRIGQQRPVYVTRFIVEGTVEKDMQRLQRTKLLMAGMARMADSTDTSSAMKCET